MDMNHFLNVISRKKAGGGGGGGGGGGTPVYESVASLDYGAYGTSFVVDKPTGTVQNDLLVFCTLQNTTTTITPPAGLTELVTGGTTRTYGIWYKIAGASEPANYTFAAGGRVGIACVRFSGIDTSTPVPVNQGSSGSSTDFDCPAATSTVTDSIALRVVFEYDDTGATADADITQLVSVSNNDALDVRLLVGYDNSTYASGVSSGVKGWTSTSTSESYVSRTLMIAGGS